MKKATTSNPSAVENIIITIYPTKSNIKVTGFNLDLRKTSLANNTIKPEIDPDIIPMKYCSSKSLFSLNFEHSTKIRTAIRYTITIPDK